MKNGDLNKCEGCPWKTRTCGSRGPIDSPFVIVGESPGTRELATQLPFSGPSGIMLREILSQVGFDSLGIEPYIINAMNCFPTVKDIRPLEIACRACHSRVDQQLRAHPRKVILTLGFAAAWTVTNDYSIRILRDRGQILSTPYAEKGCVLTLHPAYLLRNGGALPVWKKDLRQAVELLLDIDQPGWHDPTWHAVEKPSEYSELVDSYIEEGGLVTGDIETTDLHFMEGKMLCLGITKGKGDHVDIIPDKFLYGVPHVTKRLMESERILWNWQNGLFDIKWFRKQQGIKARVDEDTMLMSYSLNENTGFHDLDQIAQLWLKAPRHKEAMSKYYKKPYNGLIDAPKEELYHYNAIDLTKTHRAWFPLRAALRDDWNSLQEYRTMLIPAVEFIAEMQLYGVLADQDKIRENIILHEKEIEEIKGKINVYANKHMGCNINPASPKQVGELLYARMGLGHPSMSTDENALIQAKRAHEHPIIDLMLDFREVAKRKGTYVANILPDPSRKRNPQGFIRVDGRIHADYALHKTQTGRLAGSEPNMLNQPRGPLIRSQFVAGPGKIFCEVDLNQAELRSLALMSGDPLLMEIYTKNEVSIHDVTTEKFYASKAQILADPEVALRVRHQLLAGAHVTDDKLYGEAKMRGKAVNFGIVYGREAYSLSREFDIPMAEAQRWIDDWLGLYSGAAEFIEWCRRAPAENRALVTVFGRKKRPGVVTWETLRRLQNEFANFPHQSTASDIMLETACEVAPILRTRYGAFIWNELYDAIYFECDASDDILQQAIPYVQDVITRIPRDRGLHRIPFLGDAKIGYNWGQMSDWKGSIEASLGKQLEGAG